MEKIKGVVVLTMILIWLAMAAVCYLGKDAPIIENSAQLDIRNTNINEFTNNLIINRNKGIKEGE